MFYMWRGNIVLIDSFSDIIFLDFSFLNILVEYFVLGRHFSECSLLNYHGYSIFTLCEDERECRPLPLEELRCHCLVPVLKCSFFRLNLF